MLNQLEKINSMSALPPRLRRFKKPAFKRVVPQKHVFENGQDYCSCGKLKTHHLHSLPNIDIVYITWSPPDDMGTLLGFDYNRKEASPDKNKDKKPN